MYNANHLTLNLKRNSVIGIIVQLLIIGIY